MNNLELQLSDSNTQKNNIIIELKNKNDSLCKELEDLISQNKNS